MTTIVWKELRENVKWAVLAALLLAAGLLYALHHLDQGYGGFDPYSNTGYTLAKKDFLTATTFGFAAVGFIIGLLQILPELNPDRWAALLHRPARPGTIYLGKIVAGLILYALATVPPLAVCVYLVATPGHFPSPFVPGMVRPSLADLIAGLPYLPAALAIGLIRGGPRILRVLPLFAAINASFFVVSTRDFRLALEASLLTTLLLGLAGWGLIQHRTTLAARPWIARFAFVAVVFYALCGLGELGRKVIDTILPKPDRDWSSYEITDSGVPYRLNYTDGILRSVLDVNGDPATDENAQPETIQRHTIGINWVSRFIGDAHGWKPRRWQPDYRESRSYFFSATFYQEPRTEQWFFLDEPRTLVCYHPHQKSAVAWLGPGGFRPIDAAPEPFPEDHTFNSFDRDVLVLESPEAVRFALVAERKIVDLDLAGPIFGTGTSFTDRHNVLSVALADSLVVYTPDATRIATLPYTQDTDRWGQISVGINDDLDEFFVRYEPSVWIDRPTRDSMSSYVDVVDPTGTRLRGYVLPPLSRSPDPPAPSQALADALRTPFFFFGTLAYQKIGAALGSNRLENELKNQLVRDWPKTRILAVTLTLVSLVSAALTFFWARRAQFDRRRVITWTAFAFAFNLAGLLTFRLAADWPRKVACPDCRRRRRLDHSTCPHCAANWPANPSTGTEIFLQP